MDDPALGDPAAAVPAHSTVLNAHRALGDLLLTQLQGLAPDAPPVPGRRAAERPSATTAAVLAEGERALALAGPAGAVHIELTWCQESGAARLLGLAVTDPPGWTVRQNGRILAEAHRATPPDAHDCHSPVPPVPPQWRPLRRASRHVLSRAGLDALAAGRIQEVFDGPQAPGAHPDWCRHTGLDLLASAVPTGPGAGRHGLGHVTATVPAAPAGNRGWTELVRAVWQLLGVHALHQGLHLCLPAPFVHPLRGAPLTVHVRDVARLAGPLALGADITAIGLVPRPHLVADVRVCDARGTVAWVRGPGVALREAPGSRVAPDPATGTVRRSSRGERVHADELHMAHAAEGDLAVTYGPAAHTTAARVRPRLPRGDMLMLDRLLTAPRRDRPLGSVHTTEYDVPEVPWYVRENGGVFPWFAHLESALQATAFVGAALGTSLEHPGEDFTVRNLEGHSHLLRPVRLCGRTVRQRTTLLAHTPLPGAVLQRYAFELAVDDEVFQQGETVHGFFTRPVLARQQGLDGGRRVPPWLLGLEAPPPSARRLDADDGPPLGHGRLALLSGAECVLVPDGGRYGLGCLLVTRAVRADDWYFAHHFLDDPVLPGSCGVETLFQALKFLLLHGGRLSEEAVRGLVPVPGQVLRWTYRGQILPRDREVQAEVHLREVRVADGRLVAVADGSVWRDGLRIYAVDGIALHTPWEAP
ncbi:hotdog family protein [Streptantibioticus cattleyicolor]|uniref:Beta-ketoacyl synthase n=1 Tax=Streptantibioticus cattleyicolor (strain ATCC 35852 / DSM 46488 / JCM 4925 / NBRC 14057 / NRRL 8057) TaxID=1003195 RepID=F8JLQ8_STREN|nr:3-hydroxyacyl-ACP dehydratase [Streptantibioticus cattleyicolor]AEW99512.1 beta-ketoacyl synthase [Streptantibioticus cattleyicolor NRRL 8057 = DSM 46488]CCB71448.1 putative Beta-hydroxyacyl-(Acyl-carrier-protein) dehydratase FabA/FabZ [Streptantibioticus cattleyicolor NRRL 8057 = DSM 46488]